MSNLIELLHSLDETEFSGSLDDTLLHRLATTLQCTNPLHHNIFNMKTDDDVQDWPQLFQKWFDQASVAGRTDSLSHPALIKVLFNIFHKYIIHRFTHEEEAPDGKLAVSLRQLILSLITNHCLEVFVLDACVDLLTLSANSSVDERIVSYYVPVFDIELFRAFIKLDVICNFFYRERGTIVLSKILIYFSSNYNLEEVADSISSLLESAVHYGLQILIRLFEPRSLASAEAGKSLNLPINSLFVALKPKLLNYFSTIVHQEKPDFSLFSPLFYLFYLTQQLFDEKELCELHKYQDESMSNTTRTILMSSFLRQAASKKGMYVDLNCSFITSKSRNALVRKLITSIDNADWIDVSEFKYLVSTNNKEFNERFIKDKLLGSLSKQPSSSKKEAYLELLPSLPLSIKNQVDVLTKLVEHVHKYGGSESCLVAIKTFVMNFAKDGQLDLSGAFQTLFLDIFPKKLKAECGLDGLGPFSFEYCALARDLPPILKSTDIVKKMFDLKLLVACQKPQLENQLASSDAFPFLSCFYFPAALDVIVFRFVLDEVFDYSTDMITGIIEVYNLFEANGSQMVNGELYRELLLSLVLCCIVMCSTSLESVEASHSMLKELIFISCNLLSGLFDSRLSTLTKVLRACFVYSTNYCKFDPQSAACFVSVMHKLVGEDLLDARQMDTQWYESWSTWKQWFCSSSSCAVPELKLLEEVDCSIGLLFRYNKQRCDVCGESMHQIIDDILIAKANPRPIDCVGD